MFTKLQKFHFAGAIFLPLLWLASADLFKITNPFLFPSLTSVLNRLMNLLSDGSIFSDLFSTLYRWAYGFCAGVTLGILTGLLLGVSSRLRSFFDFPLEFLRSMPVTAIFPLFLIVFGIGDLPKIAMAFMPTFLLMVVNTTYGVSLSDQTRRKMALVFGASRFQVFKWVVVMDALPQIFVGLRLALAQSLIVIVVSEMFIGTDHGLGQRAFDSYLTNSLTTLYAILIVLGVIGYSANKLLCMLETRFIFWTGK